MKGIVIHGAGERRSFSDSMFLFVSKGVPFGTSQKQENVNISFRSLILNFETCPKSTELFETGY